MKKILLCSVLLFVISLDTVPGQSDSRSAQQLMVKHYNHAADQFTSDAVERATTNKEWQKGGLFDNYSPSQEIIEKRTRVAKHFRNDDGSYAAIIGGLLHYKDENNLWQEIDYSIRKNQSVNYISHPFCNITQDIKTYFPEKAEHSGIIMEFENMQLNFWKSPQMKISNTDQSSIVNITAGASKGIVSGNVIQYNDFPGITDEFVIKEGGLENNIIISSLQGALISADENSYVSFEQFIPLNDGYQVFYNNQEANIDFSAESFMIKSPNGSLGFVLAPVIVFDNGITKDQAFQLLSAPAEKMTDEEMATLKAHVLKGKYNIRFVPGGIMVSTFLPLKWFKESSRQFPVVIDPDIIIGTGTSSQIYPWNAYWGYGRSASLYTSAEIGVTGVTITEAYWYASTSSTTYIPLKLYLKSTTANTLTADTWANVISGATTVINGTYGFSSTGWLGFGMPNYLLNFSCANNLMVLCETNYGGTGAASYPYFYYSAATGRHEYWQQDNSAPTGNGTVNANRPNILLRYVPCAGATTRTLNASLNGTTISACCNRMFDSGGLSGTYGNSEDYYVTYQAPAGQRVQVDLNYWYLEDGFDYIYFYDGPGITSTLIHKYTGGPYINGTLTSSSNTMTIRFASDGSYYYDGFDLFVSCVPTPAAPSACNGNPPASNLCSTATHICDVDGYCGSTSSYYTPDLPGNMQNAGNYVGESTLFVGSIENNSWLSFTAMATSASLNFNVSNCTQSLGIQMGIYSGSNCTGFALLTDTAMTSGTSPLGLGNHVITANGLTVGNNYYIMVDGFAGDVCNYTITTLSGVMNGSISGPASVCAGSTSTYTMNANATGFIWSVPAGATVQSGQNTNTITVNWGSATSGNIHCQATAGVCNGAVSDLYVTVNTLSVAPSSATVSPASACSGAATSITLTASGGTSGTGAAVQWYSGNCGGTFIGSGNPLTVTQSLTSPTTYYARYSGICNTTGCTGVTVNIIPNAAISSVNGTASLCIGGSAAFTTGGIVLGGGMGAWGSSNTAVATVNASGMVTANGAGTCNIIYTITGGCGGTKSAQQTLTVTPNAAISSVSGTTPLCIGGTATFTTSGVVLGGGTGAWSSTTTAVATVNSSGLVTATGSGSCNIIYTITGGCNGTKTAQQTLTVIPNAAISTVSGTTPLCIGSTNTFSAGGVVLGSGTGAWSSSNTTVATVNAAGMVTANGAGTCNIIYTITGGCGGTKTAQQTLTVTPNAAISSVSGTTPLCIGGTASYTTGGVVLGGGTGLWSSTNTAIATVNSSGQVTAIGSGSCNIIYSITSGCSGTKTAQQTLIVTPNATISSVNGTSPLCIGATSTYSAGGIVLGGGTGAWSSSSTNVATVNAVGMVSATGAGTCNIVYTITGGCNGTQSASLNLVVDDPPTIICPSNITQNSSGNNCIAIVNYNVTATGDPAPTMSYSFTGATSGAGNGTGSGSAFNTGITNVTVTATSVCGTVTCSFTVTIIDNVYPSITCPTNITVNNTLGLCGAIVNFTTPTGTDNCPAVITTQTAGLASGVVYPVGITTNTFTVTDAAGNSSTCSFTVTVNDNQNPAITCPTNITVNNTLGLCSALVYFTPPAGTDNCTGAITVQTGGLPSGATYPVGTTINTFRVTDATGKTSTCSFTVTVNDNQIPAIICPTNITVYNTSGLCSALVYFTAPTGTDNCPGQVTTQTAGLPSGSAFPVGATVNTFLVTDAAGNTNTCSFTVTIHDNEAPSISCPSDITVNTATGLCGAPVNYTMPAGTDN
ncbi:MAG TPA: HYR domain-containing protein, partial [Bacteroidales bacterium]|nr:HYR domain-containing protein [Bacteroidales bacterium]